MRLRRIRRVHLRPAPRSLHRASVRRRGSVGSSTVESCGAAWRRAYTELVRKSLTSPTAQTRTRRPCQPLPHRDTSPVGTVHPTSEQLLEPLEQVSECNAVVGASVRPRRGSEDRKVLEFDLGVAHLPTSPRRRLLADQVGGTPAGEGHLGEGHAAAIKTSSSGCAARCRPSSAGPRARISSPTTSTRPAAAAASLRGG